MTNGDNSLEAALRILEAQFDELDKAVDSLGDDDVVRLIKIVDHLDLIIRLASFKRQLERLGLWRKHAIPVMEDPPGSKYIDPEGVAHVIWGSSGYDLALMLSDEPEATSSSQANSALRHIAYMFPLNSDPMEVGTDRSDLVDKFARYGYPHSAIEQISTHYKDDGNRR